MYIEIAESWAEINKQCFDGGVPVSQSTGFTGQLFRLETAVFMCGINCFCWLSLREFLEDHEGNRRTQQ